ncbi:MAG: hypothetical protein ACOCVR_01180, partial [Myxococcota bacterium]
MGAEIVRAVREAPCAKASRGGRILVSLPSFGRRLALFFVFASLGLPSAAAPTESSDGVVT